MAIDPHDPANPLQPGDPFKKGNFNRFTFGMMTFIVLFGALVLLYFVYARKHIPHTATPAAHSERQLTPGPSAQG